MTTLPILRRSAIQTATSCLYRYKRIWIDLVPDTSDLAQIGISFHAAAHRYIERLVSLRLTADAEEAKAAFTEGIASALTPQRLVSDLRELFVRWAERFELDVEWFLAAEEHQIGKTDQTFTPDLVYGRPSGIEVVDFKTFWHPLTAAQIAKDFQALFYLYNAMRIWPNFPSYTFTHVYVRYGTSVSVTFTQQDFEDFEATVDAVVATIAEAEAQNFWPATAGPECAYCRLECPLADNPALVPTRFPLPAQAVTVGGWILASETKLRAAKKALKAYCAVNGAIDVKGVEFDNRPVEAVVYPVEDVLRVLTARGILGAFDKDNPMAVNLTLSRSALGKLFKSFPQLETDLAPMAQRSTSYRFGAKKADDPGDEEA